MFGLGADVIAGFPGETDVDHSATMDVIRSLPFTSLHVFSYSPRPGTAAVKLGVRVPSSIVSARSAELRLLAKEKAEAYIQSRCGQRADVVITGIRPEASGSDATRTGLTEDYLTVRIRDSIPRGARVDAMLACVDGDLTATRVTI